MIFRYSSLTIAPDTHPAYNSAPAFIDADKSPEATISETEKCPPGFSTL